MSIQTPPPMMLAFWVSLAHVATQKLQEEGYDTQARIIGQASFILWEVWQREFGESFDDAFEKFNDKVHVEDEKEELLQ